MSESYELIEKRKDLAQTYLCNFDEHRVDQQKYYSKKAGSLQNRSRMISYLIIVFSACITFLQSVVVVSDDPNVVFEYMVLFIGIAITMIKGYDSIWRPGDVWPLYRTASELIKKEVRLFIAGAGDYSDIQDERSKFSFFALNIEKIISVERTGFDGLFSRE
ncbi:DUF4231 domain-containing protein [Cerasicoccus arenae]|uniref:SMODS and SLOG-associating 2TM effector domain-containing protein n=1 Tax=Cerasicoccus arenae TaxID=424488 RepID=A0A8J3DEK1_9BACT|nr:DUF4231 domain-containing protein [Cerasicoccus arenae]MBK1859530.1 DUF4231 domain-containing protein [Cerasicoccus arenae]GHB97174.1 hypothetical protein GCM10007047_11470 [Cerasicoccus arenae]